MIFVPGAGRGGCASYLPWNDGSSSSSGDILDELQLARDAEKFASAAVQAIGRGDEILSVLQGEVATAQPGDGPVGLGSDSATTCHIVGFRNPANGRTCLAHLDSADRVSEALESMLSLVSSDEGVPLDVYLVGGYLGRSCAENMSSRLISELHASPRTFRVVLACMSRLNSARSEAVRGGSTAPPLPPPPPSQGCCAIATPLSGGSLGGGIGVAESGDGSSGGGGGSSNGINEKRSILPNPGDAGLATEGSCCPQAGAGQASAGAVSDANSEHNDTQQPVEADRRGDGVGWLPRRTGLAINLASGEPFPVRFEGAGRGPGWEVRYSRTFAGGWKPLLSDIYEPRLDTIVVAPFPLWMDSFAMHRLLSLSDRELLAVTSTSPEAEAESFVADVRSCISYVLNRTRPDGQGWLENVFGGGDGAPLVYPRVAVAAAAAAAAAAVEPD